MYQRWWALILLLAVTVATPQAQGSRPVVVGWDSEPGIIQAEVEHDGVVSACPTLTTPAPGLIGCQVTAAIGTSDWRARHANAYGWSLWSDPVSLTVPPVSSADPPGPFTLLWHSPIAPRPPPTEESLMATRLGVSTKASTGNSVTSDAFDSTGATMIAVLVGSLDAAPSVSDSLGNTWTVIGPVTDGSFHLHLAYVIDPVVGVGHTVSVNDSTFPSAIVSWWSGVTAYQGASTGAADQTTPAACGSYTPASDGALLLAALMHYRQGAASITGLAIDTGYTLDTNVGSISDQRVGIALGYLNQGAAGAVNPSWSWTSGETLSNGAARQFVFTSAATPRAYVGPVNRPRIYFRKAR